MKPNGAPWKDGIHLLQVWNVSHMQGGGKYCNVVGILICDSCKGYHMESHD